MKLQLFIQEVNKSLEETSGQIVQTMPRYDDQVESLLSASYRVEKLTFML